MEKILLILESDALWKPLSEALSCYEVHTCHAGEAAKILLQLQPDALILDLFLPGTDGFALMEDCRALLPPVVLLLTVLDSDYVLQKAADLGTGFVIRKPCTTEYIARHLTEMLRIHQFPNFRDNHTIAEHLLNQFHLCTKSRILTTLSKAILISAENPDCSLTKVIYPAICREYGGSALAVDQAFRRALRNAWDNPCAAAAWKQFFPGRTHCPPNGIFISTLANHLRKKFPSRFREGERLP